MLFHVSAINKLKFLTPAIPRGDVDEESKTPRVCFAPSINCCLRSICVGFVANYLPFTDYNSDEFIVNDYYIGMIKRMYPMDAGTVILQNQLGLLKTRDSKYMYPLMHAYIPIDVKSNELYTPSIEEVYDSESTHEVWLKRPCAVKKVFSFVVTGCLPIGRMKYVDIRGNNRSYELYDYSYLQIPNDIASMFEKWKEKYDADLIEKARKKI